MAFPLPARAAAFGRRGFCTPAAAALSRPHGRPPPRQQPRWARPAQPQLARGARRGLCGAPVVEAPAVREAEVELEVIGAGAGRPAVQLEVVPGLPRLWVPQYAMDPRTFQEAVSDAGLLTQGVLGVPPDPLAPHRGPLGPSADRERAVGNAPAPVP
jgi:hypothetical protein